MKGNKHGSTEALELDGKVQVTGQEDASVINDVKGAAKPSTEIKEIEEPKSTINTRKAAEVVAAGTNSVGGGALSFRKSATTFSGGAGNTRSDESATTRESAAYRSGSRTGRQADPITRKLDYADGEIFVNKIYQSKPLTETSDGQGYTGEYMNEHAISQKCSGGVPGDPLFERSDDEISYDSLYYTEGQIVTPKQYGKEKMSIRSWDDSLNSGNGGYTAPVDIQLGNFLLTGIDVTFDTNGKIVDFTYTGEDLSICEVDERVARSSSDALRRLKNLSELDRNTMISVAGNESDPGWSALGDAVVDASDQNLCIRLLESLAGDYVGTAMRKLAEALAYAINKTAKDGARRIGPMAELLNGCIDAADHADYGATNSVSETDGINYSFYNSKVLLAGGAGLWEAVMDSLPKYNSKGKLLSLPLGPKYALSIAKNNADPLIAHNQLFDLMKKQELFSTVDGPYDPLKPVVVSDKIGLITPINPFTGCQFNTETGEFDSELYVMHYENLRNKYNIGIRNYFAQGLFDWFDHYSTRIVDHLKKVFRDENNAWTSGTKTVHIPVVSSMTSISLWDLIVCSAVPYMIERRLVTMTELLKYEVNHGYPYSKVAHLKDIDIYGAENYSFSDTDSPLTAGIAKPIAAMKIIMPEIFWPVQKFQAQGDAGHNGIGAYTVLPHYFVQNQFVYDQNTDMKTAKCVLSDNYCTMAYPSTRAGVNLSYTDTIYGMSEEDYRLSLDRMTVYPGYEGNYLPNGSLIARTRGVGTEPKFAFKTYKYGMSTDGLPVAPYFAYAEAAAGKAYTLKVSDILSTPRELGLFMVAPAGLLTPIQTASGVNNLVKPDSAYLALSGPGFRMKIYHAAGLTQENAILSAGSVNINNNASLINNFTVISCNRYGANYNNGLAFNASAGRVNLKPFTEGSYAPGTDTFNEATGEYVTGETQDAGLTLHTQQRYFWNRLQRMPFVVNPFDANVDGLTSVGGTATAINDEDIFDFMYFFGFCGFRASDYHALVMRRVKDRIAKGMNYIIDPFMDKSMLLK